MAISVSFNGATIYRPGSYSKTIIDLGGNVPLGPAGLVAIFGEADAGTPGSAEVNIAQNFYTADRLSEAKAKYRSGPIADALQFLFSPAADGAIPNGAQTVWVYKTNASVRATRALGAYGTVRAREWGIGGNRITFKAVASGNGQAEIAGTPPALGSALSGQSVTFRVNGGSLITATFSAVDTDHDTLAEVAIELNAIPAFAAELVASVVGTQIVVKTVLNPTKYEDGFGDCFEVVSGGTLLGFTSGLNVSAVEPELAITINNKRDLLVETDTVGGDIVLSIGRDSSGGATSASVTVGATTITLTDSTGSTVLNKADYATLRQLVEAINLYPGWTASIGATAFNNLPLSSLDRVSAVGAFSVAGLKPARIKKDAYDVATIFAESSIVEIVNPIFVGLPAAASEAFLSGGAKGATSPADITAALSKFEKFHVNFVLPLFARDATDDIADDLTDASSTYTIDGVHQAVKNHISLMRSTKKRSERQAVVAFKDTWENCKAQAAEISEAAMQLVVQDVRQVDAQGNIKWFQPWALASLITGMRCGATIGLPLTFKFANCSGIRHTAQPMSTPEASIVVDFDPDIQYEDAIQSGITFLEAPTTGGFRIVVDNTTYGVDNNWVYNRGHVLYAANIVSYNFRNAMEARYIGVKNTVRAAEVKSTAESVLNTFLAQGITVSTGDAPNGYKDLSVRIDGNTIYITVTVKLVEGIDFVLSEITIQRATQTA